jgi:hypothetical protein
MKCAYCGTENDTVATHSNVEECSLCWNYRKLDRPAALHWAQVAREFLSNVDTHDMMTYLPASLKDAKNGKGEPVNVTWDQLLCGAQAVMLHSDRLLIEGPPHMWAKDEEKHWSDTQKAAEESQSEPINPTD